MEYVFTDKHATVFSRYVEYHYDQVLEEVDKHIHYAKYFVFMFKDAKCTIMYDNTFDSSEITIVKLKVDFISASQTIYVFREVVLWKKDEEICLNNILEIIRGWTGEKVRICLCDDPISNPKMDRCEECYVFHVVQDENCCICMENGFRWVKLLCNCKDGRMIHRHCFMRLEAHFQMDSIWKKKCPCCRKFISMWRGNDIVVDPNFK